MFRLRGIGEDPRVARVEQLPMESGDFSTDNEWITKDSDYE
ncbi:hypothetical protein SPH9361_04738 [Sphingobium sp. CECT 9361]|nr:hypothetical protein SPH9361_04738 [Sphingobium sp. CECT 9361]